VAVIEARKLLDYILGHSKHLIEVQHHNGPETMDRASVDISTKASREQFRITIKRI
jgi:hypothetical protein